MSKIINDIVYKGESYKFSDIEARNRLDNVEYQTVVTEEAYLHTDLPKGEKTVTISGDGSWGNKEYLNIGEDLILRNNFNQSMPYNGITITCDKNVYHIKGTNTASSTTTIVCSEGTNYWKYLPENSAGKRVKILTFADEAIEGSCSFTVQFKNDNNEIVNVTLDNGTVKNSVGTYVTKNGTARTTTFTIPTEAKQVKTYFTFVSGNSFDGASSEGINVQVYMVLEEDLQTIALTDATTIEDVVNDTLTIQVFPYQAAIFTKSPLADYIEYRTKNTQAIVPTTYLTPEEFGAIGDGYADDSEAIALCLETAAETK